MSQSQKTLSLLPHIIYRNITSSFKRHKPGVNTFEKRNILLLKPKYLNIVREDMTDLMTYKKGSTEYVSKTLKKAENIRLYS